MENRNIYYPTQPRKPELLSLKNYNWTDLLSVDSWIIFGFAFVYGIHFMGGFEISGIYYFAISFYIIIRLWPFLVTNGKNRKTNKKMIESYDKEVIKFEKSLKEYYILKTKMNLELENRRKLEQQRRAEVERENRLELNRQKNLEVERQNKIDIERQNKPQPAFTSKDSTIIKKTNNQLEVEINNTIRNYSGICAALAIQPIPFADIFILTPTQILMGKKIASLRGYEIKENSIESILKEISGIIGMGIIAQQLVIGAYKTFLPFLGGFTTIPVVYGLTYGIGKTMDYYILAKINGTQINKIEIEKIFKSSRSIGEREGKAKEKDIHAKSKTNDNKI